ncbi:SGNH/GDSL hydrolase family protein [uncultured Pseudoalteromonas sp.]|uniref:SGNH/GDSL hydrolase family protein n=1 Tax=uncultured Pseudoalteromonas sp. TaxID=114053 RepID=UPI00259745F6|nr:SGNH/GDSL hydrolase family protein [uncultured Pseudoalteromonas sp.]
MANYLTLVEQLSTAVDQLNQVLQGDETTTVDINGKVQPSVQKKTLDEVTAKIQLVLDAAADIDAVKYVTTAAGIAATTDGQFFSVVSDDVDNYLDLFKNESGVAAFKKSYPSSEAVKPENTVSKDNTSKSVTGKAVDDVFSKKSVSKNRLDKNGLYDGYLVPSSPYDGEITVVGDPNLSTKTSNFIYVGDLNVGDRLYISGLGNDSYGRGYARYGKDLNFISGGFISGNITESDINGRPNESVEWVRITLVTIKPSENTDISSVAISSNGYLSEYEEYEGSVFNVFNGVISANHTDKTPLNDNSPVSLSYATDNYIGKVFNPYNLINLDDTEVGFLPTQAPFDGKLIAASNYLTSGYIDISELNLTDSMFLSGIFNGYGRSVYFYDENKDVVLNGEGAAYRKNIPTTLNGEEYEITNVRPSLAAVFMRLTLITGKPEDTTDANFVQLSPYSSTGFFLREDKLSNADIALKKAVNAKDVVNLETLKEMIVTPTESKLITVFGDSISDPIVAHNWPNVIDNYINVTIENVAKSGGHWENFGGVADDPRWFTTQVDLILATGSDPDIIFIAMGTNSSAAITGDFETTLTQDFNALSLNTIYGGMRYGLEKLRIRWPTVPIFMATPLQRASRSPFEPSSLLMVEVIEKMAEVYSCTVVDAGKESGINHQIEKAGHILLHDGLHPNSEGSKMQAKYFASKIKAILVGL